MTASIMSRYENYKICAQDTLLWRRGCTTFLVSSTNSKYCNPIGKFEEKLANTIFH